MSEPFAEGEAENGDPEPELTNPEFWRDAMIPLLILCVFFVAGPIVLCTGRWWKLRALKRRHEVVARAKGKLRMMAKFGKKQGTDNTALKSPLCKLVSKNTSEEKVCEEEPSTGNSLLKAVLRQGRSQGTSNSLSKRLLIAAKTSASEETEMAENPSVSQEDPNKNTSDIDARSDENCKLTSQPNSSKLSNALQMSKKPISKLKGFFAKKKRSYVAVDIPTQAVPNLPKCANYQPFKDLMETVRNEGKVDENGASTCISPEFLHAYDREIMCSLAKYVTSSAELLWICGPCMLSLALCPLTLYMYQPLVDAFWWSTDPDMLVLPNVNEAIMCFLMPAGVVYATSFGFAIQTAMDKQGDISAKMTTEIGMLDQIMSLTAKLVYATAEQKCLLYTVVKNEAVNLIQDIGNKKHRYEYKESSWFCVNMLRNIDLPKKGFYLDMITTDKIVQLLLKTKDSIGKKIYLHGRIHIMQWLFLELLGFITFFGILLTQTKAYKSDLCICMLTVMSISLLCYVVADLDSPFSGFFSVDVRVILDVIYRAENMHNKCKASGSQHEFCGYPRK